MSAKTKTRNEAAAQKAQKKKQKPTPKRREAEKRKRPNALQRFISETRGELAKVSWPTREEALRLTRIVLIVTFGMSLFLGLIDWVFTRLFALLFGF